jgi:hypothetical protein
MKSLLALMLLFSLNSYASGWTDWSNIGGPFKGDPAVCFHGARIEFFGWGIDNNLWQRSWTGSEWTSWTNLGGPIGASPAVACGSPTRVDVFVLFGNKLSYRTSNGGVWDGWRTWNDRTFTTAPAVIGWAPDRIELVIGGPSGQVMYNSYWGGWGEWQDLGGQISADPSITMREAGKFDVAVRGMDNSIWQLSSEGGAWAWKGSLGGVSTSSPEISSREDGKLDLFIRGADGFLYMNSFDSTNWSGWISQGTPVASGSSVVRYGPNGLLMVTRLNDNNFYYRVWSP